MVLPYKRKKEKTMIIHKIEATKPQSQRQQPITRLLKVAAYCRVSTEQDEQINSYEAQIEHYNTEFSKHKDWLNVGVFADRGITGTMAKKRPEFLRMIRLCRQHKIDLILTKSISRFSRNTVDCLEYIRELKSLGIGVIFEKENINTLTETSEAMITIMGYFAQAESESISKNVTWGVRQAFSQGKVTFTCDIYGYHKTPDGVEIVKEEAEVIRDIFHQYLCGASTQMICKNLNDKGIPSPSKTTVWKSPTIQTILRNEKYKGDVITQKTYCPDFLSHKRVKNTGQIPQHYITDHHKAIVNRETFDRVQAEYARRNAKKKSSPYSEDTPKRGKYSGKYALTELLICGNCGAPYRRCTWSHHGYKKIVWRCTTKMDYGKEKCSDSYSLEENRLHTAILKALADLSSQKNVIKDELKTALVGTFTDCGTDISILALEQQIQEQENEMMKLVNLSIEHGNQQEFEAEFRRISHNITDLRRIIEVEKTKIKPQLDIDTRLEQLFETIDAASADIQTFDDATIRQLIAQIRVINEHSLQIILVNGFQINADM